MSLNNWEASINKYNALLKYDGVVEELGRSRAKIRTLETKFAKAEEEISVFKNLKVRFDGKDISLGELNEMILTLEREIHREEIERKTREKFRAESPNLTVRELNRLLTLPASERPSKLNALLNRERDKQVNLTLKNPDDYPQWFKKDIDTRIGSEVQKRLNDVFWANVREQVERTKREEWTPYLNEHSRKKITPYVQGIILNKFLQEISTQEFQGTCQRCGTLRFFNIKPQGIADLFKGIPLKIDCANLQCKGMVYHTTFPFSLGDAIMQLVGTPTMPTEK